MTIEQFIHPYNKSETIMSHYIANKYPLAIIFARQFDYDGIAIEKRKTPLQIIKETCCHHLSTYEGRRQAIIKQTSFKYKVPILFNEKDSLLSFPTEAPSHFDCTWIFPTKINSIQRDNHYSSITFQNELNLQLNISYYSLHTQVYH